MRLEKTQFLQLETAVDCAGIGGTLRALSEICWEKAQHIEREWQDKATARPWRKAAIRLDVEADKVESLFQ